jgi:hypothetical protein
MVGRELADQDRCQVAAEMRGPYAELRVLEKNATLIAADDRLVYLLSRGIDPDHVHVDTAPAVPYLHPVEFGSVDQQVVRTSRRTTRF